MSTQSTTLTIRVPGEVKEKLGRLAERTRRSRSFLAGEAIESYLERELAILEGIEQGRADIAADRAVPHEEAIARLRKAVDAAGEK